MELNGLYNLIMQVRKWERDGLLTAEHRSEFEHQAFLFDKYLVAHRKNPDLYWHEVIESPDDYLTNSQEQALLFKQLKEGNGNG